MLMGASWQVCPILSSPMHVLQELLDSGEDLRLSQISMVNQHGAVVADVSISLQALKALEAILDA